MCFLKRRITFPDPVITIVRRLIVPFIEGQMQHRSFRLTPNRRSDRRVIRRLRVIHGCVFAAYFLIGIAVIGLLMIVGSHTEFSTDNKPNWLVLVAFSVLGVLGVQFIELSVFQAGSRLSLKYLAGRWMTTEQATHFPGLRDPWPDCWLDPTDDEHSEP